MVRVVRGPFGWCSCVCITEITASFSSLWAAVMRKHINALSIIYNESRPIHRTEQQTQQIATLLTLEIFKWEYSFATAVFSKLGSLLSGTSRHYYVLGLRTILDITTSEHVISGHIQQRLF